jgi:hypothetical protein
VTSLQAARRLETAMLVQLLTGAAARERDAADDAEKGGARKSAAPARACEDAAAGARPTTRRAAGLMAAPQAEVIGETTSFFTNALFVDSEDGAPHTKELRGVLINTGPPAQQPAARGRAAPPAPATPPAKAQQLARKLTQ